MPRFLVILFILFSGIFTAANGQASIVVSPAEEALLVKAESLIDDIFKQKFFQIERLDSLRNWATKINTDFAIGVTEMAFGKYYRKKNNLESALLHFTESINHLEVCCPKSKELVNSLFGYNTMAMNTGLFNTDTLMFKKGIKRVRQAVNICKINKDTFNLIDGLDYLGDFHFYTAYRNVNFDTAVHYYKQVEQILKFYKSEKEHSDNALGLANVYRELSNVEQEQLYFEKSKSIAEKNGYFGILYALYFDKANYLEDRNDDKGALKLKEKGYEYVLQSGSKEFINRADRQLYYTHKQLGNHEKALTFFEKYQKSVEEMNKSEALQLQNKIEFNNQISEKENQITQLELKNYKNSRNYLILASLLSLGLFFIALWANKSLRQKNKTLEQKNKEIVLAQLKGQNIERKRMAGELHDNLNTKLAAVRWQLEAIDDDTNPIIKNAIHQLNDVYEDVRLISHNLMPETVESIGLLNSIEDLIVRLNNSDKVKFQFNKDEVDESHFSAYTYPIYNIIFEMVNNILKHSDAKNAWISLSQNELGDLKISVSDDGKGFDVDQISGGYGLKSIISRVENLHGEYNIESAPGKGTKVFVDIPKL